jgi:hypothetical protein
MYPWKKVVWTFLLFSENTGQKGYSELLITGLLPIIIQ